DGRALLSAVRSRGQFHPEVAVEPIVRAKARKPIVTFFTPQADRSLALAAAAGSAAFRTPEACRAALAAVFGWRMPRARPAGEIDIGSLRGFDLFSQLGVPVAPWAMALAPEFRHSI